MGMECIITKLGKNLNSIFKTTLEIFDLQRLALVSGLVQRSTSRLKGDEFVKAAIIEAADGGECTLNSFVSTLIEIKETAKMSKQALSKRLNTPQAVEFLKLVLYKSFAVASTRIENCIGNFATLKGALKKFNSVYIQDSSESMLDAKLKDEFKGSGGGSGNGKGEASVKIDVIYEFKKKVISYFKVTDRREPDSVLSDNIMTFIKRGDLVIRDLGYIRLDVFSQIMNVGAYFLSRLKGSFNVYLNANDVEQLNLGPYLKKTAKNKGYVDIPKIYIGKVKLSCRLIAYQVPKDVEKQRRRDYLKESKKKKRKPNQAYMDRMAFTIYITNVPSTIWCTTVVGTVYRIRWQIELIFKSWKSDLGFHNLSGKNGNRILCLIHAKLIMVLLMHTVHSCIDYVAFQAFEKETSFHKVVQWLNSRGKFAQIIMKGFTEKPWNLLVDQCEMLLCKDKRKRMTTSEQIENLVPFITIDDYTQPIDDEYAMVA